MKKNIGCLSMNDIYNFIDITDLGEMNYNICENCGRAIRYMVHLKDSQNKSYYVGTECAKTLSEANINHSYSMNEQIKHLKTCSTVTALLKDEKTKIWGNKDYFIIIGKTGKNPIKLQLKPVFDIFLQKNYSFIDVLISEVDKRSNVIRTGYCLAYCFDFYDSLKDSNYVRRLPDFSN